MFRYQIQLQMAKRSCNLLYFSIMSLKGRRSSSRKELKKLQNEVVNFVMYGTKNYVLLNHTSNIRLTLYICPDQMWRRQDLGLEQRSCQVVPIKCASDHLLHQWTRLCYAGTGKNSLNANLESQKAGLQHRSWKYHVLFHIISVQMWIQVDQNQQSTHQLLSHLWFHLFG